MNAPYQNRLKDEKSPYLLQHADNPVDWRPWGEAAFDEARREDKPVFLSIGYSTCHWCHVMAHESFEDPEAAKVLNEVFVCIKVDREERPDLDGIYMTAAQMMSGRGGWPLNVVLTPDKKPFFSATYIPKQTRFGMVGLMELARRIQEIWRHRRQEVLASAGQVTSALHQVNRRSAGDEIDETVLTASFRELETRFDAARGGFGAAPKFPTPQNVLFLLRYWKRAGAEKALDMAEKTLRAMRLGGVYDHLGYGFHRYATDDRWLLPHFEKMLYDQALLIPAYVEAWQATKKDEYKQTVKEVIAYALRDLTDADGGFYSGEDADSEGEEGKFYVWTAAEIRDVLGREDADLFSAVYNVAEEGNFLDESSRQKTGANVLFLSAPLPEQTARFNMPPAEFEERLAAIRQRLLAARGKRVRPHLDDKILTDWNGLMIAALARASRALDVPEYAAAAEKAADFILTRMIDADGRLLHRFRDGEAAISAHADDYAFLIHGLVELYQTGFNTDHLRTALRLNAEFTDHFWDEDQGGFFFTADDGEKLLVRQKEIYDGALPSANSAAMLNLLRLARITADTGLEEKAAMLSRVFSENAKSQPSAYNQLLIAADFSIGPSREIVIAGDPDQADARKLFRALNENFIPNAVTVRRPPEGDAPDIAGLAPYVKNQKAVSGKAAAYVCENHACRLPATTPEEMLRLLA